LISLPFWNPGRSTKNPHVFNTRDRLAPGNAVIVPKFINRCLWDRSRNDVSQAAEIGHLGIYFFFFGAKGLMWWLFDLSSSLRNALNFRIELNKLCHFVTTVQKNYRPVAYHNWCHAFTVCHCMYFCQQQIQGVFKDEEVRGAKQPHRPLA
jgi:hypothetical protein